MTIAIMQPYLFPYLGYFQLLKAADRFIVYDDVHFIKRGWINRNAILLNRQSHVFTLPCKDASRNRLINETEIRIDDDFRSKLMKMFEHAYKKAPFFMDVRELLRLSFESNEKNVASFTINSIVAVCRYLDLKTEIVRSSEVHPETKGMGKADRLIAIARKERADNYINSIGGMALYDKEYFRQRGIALSFLRAEFPEYKQFGGPFISGLSIIDVLMFNSKNDALKMLGAYTLI